MTTVPADLLRDLALRQSEERFRTMTTLSADWYWEQDAQFRFVASTERSPRYVTLPPDGGLGKTRWELAPDGASPRQWQAHQETLAAHLPFQDFVYQRRDPLGRLRHVSVSGLPVFDEQGVFCGYHGIARDITERKREDSLLQLEHSVVRWLSDADTGTAVALQGVIEALCETEGWEYGRYWRLDEAAGVLRFATSWHRAGSVVAPHLTASESTVFQPGEGLVGRVWQSGQPMWVSDLGQHKTVLKSAVAPGVELHGACVLPVASRGSVIGVMTFVSREVREPDDRLLQACRVIGSQIGQFLQRKQREQALRESEARFRALTELSSDWFWEQDADLRFVSVNTGSVSWPEGLPASANILGKTRWELVDVEMDDWPAHRAMLLRREPFHDVELRRRTAGGEIRYVAISGSPLFDDAGRFTGYRGVGRDITVQKLAQQEIARLNAQLEERVRERTAQLQEANAELEAFSYSIAHDLRSPLIAIDGFTHALEDSCRPLVGERGQHYLRRIRAGVRQMGDLTDAMLSLALLSRVSLKCEKVDLAELTRAALARLREREPGREVDADFPGHLWVHGDPRLLAQVMTNLMDNAWKFSQPKPRVQLRLGSEPGEGGETVYFLADQGVGFDMVHSARLFGAFQRLHTPTEFDGTGIGLALVHKIISRHGGRIWAQARPGEGATIYFTLGSPAQANSIRST